MLEASTRQVELTLEERLAMENLRLKIQMAEMQKQAATQQLQAFTQGLVTKYRVPPGAQMSITDSHLTVSEPEAIASDAGGQQRVLSEAEAMAATKAE